MALASLFLGGLVIVLPPEAHVRGTELALGSLAQVRGDDAALVERAKSVELGWAPAPGYTRVLQRWQIEQKLAAALAGTAIAFEGSEATRIAPETTRVRGDELRARAEGELRTLFGKRDLVLQPAAAAADLEVPLGQRPTELRCTIEKREQHAGAWSVPVQVWVDGTLYQTAWVGFTAELYEFLPVLARDVRRGEVLESEALSMQRVKLSSDLGGEPLSRAALAGASVLHDLGAGSVLTERDVLRAKLVKSGESVQLQVRKGAITARGSAIAKADGAAGERIRVQTQDKSREVTGVVIGRGLVEIDLCELR